MSMTGGVPLRPAPVRLHHPSGRGAPHLPKGCPPVNLPARPMPKPTAQVAPYVECLGAELAVTFLPAYGGGEVYLARDPKGRSAVEALVGAEAVRAMSAHHRIGERVRPPLAKAWRAAMLRWQGHSVAHIARTLRASEGSVYGWLKKVEQ